jgi:hypothetical protein
MPSNDLRTSKLSNLILKEKLMADDMVENETACRNLRYAGSWPRQAPASVAEDDIVMVVVAVVICRSCRVVQVWRQMGTEF